MADRTELTDNEITTLVIYAAEQVATTWSRLSSKRKYPESGNPYEDEWNETKPGKWTSGFLSGLMWMIYHFTGDDQFMTWAERSQDGLIDAQREMSTHDVGFVFFNSFGWAYRITKDKKYLPTIQAAAESLSARYNPIVKCTRSWDNTPRNQQPGENVENRFLVIIDNLMNLNLLFWSAKQFSQVEWHAQAHAHALRTAQDFLRADGSTYHVLEYHSKTGELLRRRTHQGLGDESCWSRGQAWAVYGFTECYRHTRDQGVLQAAIRVADRFVAGLPEDAVPYWDFDAAAEEGYQPRDTSAAAIAASGLLELSLYTGEKESEYYWQAQRILKSLASDKYLTRGDPKAKISSLLLHGTITNPAKDGLHDVALIYADYFFIEALQRTRDYPDLELA